MARPLALVALAAPLLGCPTVGDGDEASASRTITEAIRALEVFDALEVTVTVDPSAAEGATIDLTGDANLLDLVVSELHSGDVLSLGMWATVETEPTLPMRAELVTPALERVFVGGTAGVVVDGLAGDALELRARDQSALNASVTTPALGVDVDHKATVRATGEATVLEVLTAGNADVDASELTVVDAEIHHASAGELRLCASRALRGELSGDGTLVLLCAPTEIDVDVTGDGAIEGP
ncbi:MAG: DUF2807 domain-containing protein [Myxococcales bacterium]|nr:DUF2807 domain-containing protein [Myxococcales bacterium]